MAAQTEKISQTRLPTVVRLKDSTISWLEIRRSQSRSRWYVSDAGEVGRQIRRSQVHCRSAFKL